MRIAQLICGAGMFLVCLAQFPLASAQEGASPPVRQSRADAEKARLEGEDLEQFTIQLVIVELRGDVQRALKEAGFQESGGGQRYVATAKKPEAGGAEQISLMYLAMRNAREEDVFGTLLKSIRSHAEVTVLSKPQIRMLAGQQAEIFSGSQSSTIPYFVRTGKTTFEMREMDIGKSLGFHASLTARPGDDAEQIVISPIKLSTTVLEGREPIPGVDMDIGKPIVSTRTLETSITVYEGAKVNVALPGLPDRQPVVFFTAHRSTIGPAPAVLPNPVIEKPASR